MLRLLGRRHEGRLRRSTPDDAHDASPESETVRPVTDLLHECGAQWITRFLATHPLADHPAAQSVDRRNSGPASPGAPREQADDREGDQCGRGQRSPGRKCSMLLQGRRLGQPVALVLTPQGGWRLARRVVRTDSGIADHASSLVRDAIAQFEVLPDEGKVRSVEAAQLQERGPLPHAQVHVVGVDPSLCVVEASGHADGGRRHGRHGAPECGRADGMHGPSGDVSILLEEHTETLRDVGGIEHGMGIHTADDRPLARGDPDVQGRGRTAARIVQPTAPETRRRPPAPASRPSILRRRRGPPEAGRSGPGPRPGTRRCARSR